MEGSAAFNMMREKRVCDLLPELQSETSQFSSCDLAYLAKFTKKELIDILNTETMQPDARQSLLSLWNKFFGDLHLWKQENILIWASLVTNNEKSYNTLVSLMKRDSIENGYQLFEWAIPRDTAFDIKQQSKLQRSLAELQKSFSPEKIIENYHVSSLSTFIYLDHNNSPRIDVDVLKKYQSESDTNAYTPVISFVGQSGAGKSFFVNQFLDRTSQSNGPVVAQGGSDGATSSDIHIFRGNLRPSNRKVLLLDVEGSSGGIPKMYALKFGQLEDQAQKIREKRLKARNKYLFPLAYAVSDALVYLSPCRGGIELVVNNLKDLSDKLERISGACPNLIIVQNMQPSQDEEQFWNVEAATKQFEKDCTTVPNWDNVRIKFKQLNVIYLPRRNENPKLFTRQLNNLHRLLDNSCCLVAQKGGNARLGSQEFRNLQHIFEAAEIDWRINAKKHLSNRTLQRWFEQILNIHYCSKKSNEAINISQFSPHLQNIVDYFLRAECHLELINLNFIIEKLWKSAFPTKLKHENTDISVSLQSLQYYFQEYYLLIQSAGTLQVTLTTPVEFPFSLLAAIDDDSDDGEIIAQVKPDPVAPVSDLENEFKYHNARMTEYCWYNFVCNLVEQSTSSISSSVHKPISLELGAALLQATRPSVGQMSKITLYFDTIFKLFISQVASHCFCINNHF